MRKWWMLATAFMVALLASCGLGQGDQELFVKVDPEFHIGMMEQLGTERGFALVIQTIEAQPCINNIIDFEYGQTRSEILINVKNIVEAENCIPGDSIIQTSANISPLANGKIDLALILKNTVNGTGTLTVDSEKYQLEIEEGHGFLPREKVLYKIPMGLIWGYVTYPSTGYEEVTNNLLLELNDLTTSMSLKVGNYGHFSIDDNQKLVISPEDGPMLENTQTFYRQIGNTTPEALESLLNSYRGEYTEAELRVELFTWDGQRL